MEIIVDPGHGGFQPAGKSSPLGYAPSGSAPEKILTLDLARAVAGRLGGARLTRAQDENLTLQRRRAYAQPGARAFVSLHASPGDVDDVWVHPQASAESHGLARAVAQALGGRVRTDAEMAILSPHGMPPGLAACLVDADYHALAAGGAPGRSNAIAQGIRRFLYGGGAAAVALGDPEAYAAAGEILRFFWPDSELGTVGDDHVDVANVVLQAYLECRRLTDMIPELLRGVARLTPPLIRPFINLYRRVLDGGLLTAACRNTVAAAYATARRELANGLRPTISLGLSSYNPGSYGVPGAVRPIRQPATWACWATTYAMMVNWKNGTNLSPRAAVAGVGQEWADMFDANTGLPWADYPRFAAAAGLQTMPPQNLTVEGWLDKFREVRGPIWVAHIPGGGTAMGGHAWVLEGIEYDGTDAGSTMFFVDPASGSRTSQPFPRFIPEYEERFIRSGQVHVLHF